MSETNSVPPGRRAKSVAPGRDAKPKRIGMRRRRGLLVAASVVVAVTGAWLLADAVATRELERSVDRFEAEVGPVSAPAEREPDEDARRIARFAEERFGLRLDLAPGSRESDGGTPDFRAHHLGLRQHVEGVTSGARAGPVPSAPRELAAWLEGHRAELDTLSAMVRAAGPTDWGVRPPTGSTTSVPGLLGHFWMQHVLLGDALAALAEGDEARALDRLDAAWRLRDALEQQPLLIARIHATLVLDRQARVLREVRALPRDPWVERLARVEPVGATTEAIATEARYALATVEAPRAWSAWWDDRAASAERPVLAFAADGWPARLGAHVVAAPLRKRAVAQQLDALRAEVVALRARGACVSDPEAHLTVSGSGDAGSASWIGAPRTLAATHARAAIAAFQVELTRRVLAVRRGGDVAEWEAPCEAWRFEAVREDSGALLVRSVGAVPWPSADSWDVAPRRHRIAP